MQQGLEGKTTVNPANGLGYGGKTHTDPIFTTRAELEAWVRQRCRFPDPAPDARLRAVEDCRRVIMAHSHLCGPNPSHTEGAA